MSQPNDGRKRDVQVAKDTESRARPDTERGRSLGSDRRWNPKEVILGDYEVSPPRSERWHAWHNHIILVQRLNARSNFFHDASTFSPANGRERSDGTGDASDRVEVGAVDRGSDHTHAHLRRADGSNFLDLETK